MPARFSWTRAVSKRRFQLEMIQPVHRFYIDPPLSVVLLDVERNDGAGSALRPYLTVKIRQASRRRSGDPDNDIAALETRLLAGPFRTHARDHQVPALLLGVDAEPGLRRPGRMPLRQQVGEDRRKRIDRHEHIAGLVLAAGIADDQRPDANQLAVAVDQRGAAPGEMRRGSKDRVVEEVLPAAGKLASRHDPNSLRVGGAAGASRNYRIALAQLGGLAERHG